MPNAITLPKVANYIKNVGKSVKLASIEYMKEDVMPATADFLETNDELFKEIYSATVNYKNTFKKAKVAVKKSKIYEAAEVGWKALFEDLKSGNWYNKEREEALGMKALDMDMDDMDFDPSMLGFDDDDDSDAAKQSRAFDVAIEASTKAQAGVTARSANMVSETIKTSNTALMMQTEKIMATMTAGMGNIHAAVSGVGKYLEGPMMTHIQNTKVYQEKSLEHLNNISSQLDEMLQMQRNLYKAADRPNINDPIGDIISFEGYPDIKEYAKQVYKNTKKVLGPEFEMIFGDAFGKDANPLLTFVSSPLKYIPELFVKTIIPVTVKKAAESLDKTMSGVFTTLISRLNKLGSDDSDGWFLNYAGKIFGIEIKNKTSVDTNKFSKGPVPFDGITRKTIVDVIPAHLRRIESALTGGAERIFDMRSGKWTDANKLARSHKERQEAASQMAVIELRDALSGLIDEFKSKKDKDGKPNQQAIDKAKSIEAAITEIGKRVYEEGGRFLGNKVSLYKFIGDKDAPWSYYGIDEDIYKKIMKELNSSQKGRAALMGLANETIGQIQSWNRYMTSIEEGDNPIAHLFNGNYDINKLIHIKDGKVIEKENTNVGIANRGNMLIEAIDDKGKNIFYYLQGIYGTLLMGGGSGKSKKGGYGYKGITPEEALKNHLNHINNLNNPPHTHTQSSVQGENTGSNGNGEEPEKVSDIYENYELKKLIEERAKVLGKNADEENKTFVKKFKEAHSIGDKFKAIRDNVQVLMTKPGEFLTNLINAADLRLYQAMFGKDEDLNNLEVDFKKPGGIIERITYKIEDTFSKLSDWLEDNVFSHIKQWLDDVGITDKYKKAKDWIKDKIRWEDIKNAFANKFKFARRQVGSAFNQVSNDVYPFYKRNYKYKFNNKAKEEEEFTVDDDYFDWLNPDFAASGKFITKRGLAVVSPGETIIPATFDRAGQKRQLSKEKAYARRFGITGANYYAEGTDSPTGMAQSVSTNDTKQVESTIKKIAHEISPGTSIVDIAVNSLLGGGVSLITGMIGGPLLGAAAGAGIGIIKQSQTAKDLLFGTEVTDENGNVIEKKGLISKKFQKNFEKYFPDIKNYGIVGAAAGLLTPLGLVGGLMAGGAIGFLKNNESTQKFLFGEKNAAGERDGGLISKAFRDKVKKAAPRMLTGAAGAALLTPIGGFGIIGNAILGSALGFVTTTDTFHNIVFGKEDENGERKGGIVDALKKGFVEPLIKFGKDLLKEGKDFLKYKILKPLKDFISPVIQMIRNTITSIGDKIKESFDKKVMTPISDFVLHKLLEPMGKTLGKIIRAPINLAKSAISLPFAALGGIGNRIRASQINRGTATNMTAAERIAWRGEHRNIRFLNNVTGKAKFANDMDNILATQFQGDDGLDKMREMRDNLKLLIDSKKKFGNNVTKLEQTLLNEISDILNTNTMEVDGSTVSVYTYLGYGPVHKINKLIAAGRIDEISKELNTGKFKEVPVEVRNQIIAKVNELGGPIYEAAQKYKDVKESTADFEASMRTRFGIKNMESFKRLAKNLDKEISVRESLNGAIAEDNNKSIAEAQTDRMQEFLGKKSDIIINKLENIRRAIIGQEPIDESVAENAIEGTTETISGEDNRTFAERYADINDKFNTGLRRFGRKVVGKAKSKIESATGILGRFARNVTHGISRYAGSVKDAASEGYSIGISGVYNKHQQKKFDQYREEVANIGAGIITGNEERIKALYNKGYHMEDGVLKDGNGEVLNTNNAKDYEAEQKEKKSFFKMAGGAFGNLTRGIVSIATGLLGSGWRTVKKVKNSIFDFISEQVESNTWIGKAIGSIFGIGKMVLTASMIGHVAEFWTNTLWNPIIKPFWEDKIKPFFSNVWTKVHNFIDEKFPKLGTIFEKLGEKFETFFKNPLGSIANFFVDGLRKFWDYVEVPLYNLVYKAFNGVTFADFRAEREAARKEYQARDENGNLLYLDENGNTTTENTGTAKMTTTNVTTERWEDGLINNLTNDGIKQRSTAHNSAGMTFIYTEYYNGAVAVQNTDTGAWISLNDGMGSSTMNVGWMVDINGKPLVKDPGVSLGALIPSSITAVVAAKIAGIGVAALTAKIGGVLGSTILPGLGTIIGFALGFAIGLGVSIALYKVNKDNGLAVQEENISCNSSEGIRLLQSFGIGGKGWPNFPTVTETPSNGTDTSSYGYTDTSTSYDVNGMVNSNNMGTTQSGSRRSGTSHVYQKAMNIANQKFGNSTIGEAGCGPVAATNLINKMGGKMDVGTAAAYAENGGFIDPATGGATTSYINSILNDSGIASRETTSKSEVLSSLRRGNPVVMLGNSGTEHNTPFGSNDHYITAMGIDKRGNIIAEDPDLPDSYRSYKASRVMNDMSVGIATGTKRKSGLSRVLRSGRAKVANMVSTLSGGGSIGIRLADWTFRCAECIALCESASAGDYVAVNKNDVGSMSVGRYQFHKSRATKLLNEIINDLISDNVYTRSTIRDLLGKDLYDYITGISNENFKPTTKQVNALKTILGSAQGKNAQDRTMVNDINNYYSPITNKLGLKMPDQENIIIYMHSIIHNAGTGGGATICKDIINKATSKTGKTVSKLNLDDIHDAALSTSYGSSHKKRLETQFNYLSTTETAGNHTSTYKDDDYTTAVSKYKGGNTGLTALNADLYNVMRSMYGSNLMGIFKNGTLTSSIDEAVTEKLSAPASADTASAQQAVVNWMKSWEGKVKYATSGEQDPSKGQSSCANTVYMAYRKALGLPYRNGNGIASKLMEDPNFQYVYRSPIMTRNLTNPRYADNKNISGSYNESVMQPGDIIYYRTRNDGYGTEPLYGGGHVEMYIGDGKRIGHGGPGYGTNIKTLASNSSNIIGVKRYVPFIKGESTSYTNPSSGLGRNTAVNGRHKALRGSGINSDTRKYIESHEEAIPSGPSAVARSGRAAVSYEDFLNIIVELLSIIAKNSDKVDQIITLLAKNNVSVSSSDVTNAGSSRSAQSRLKDAIRHSGLGRRSNNSYSGGSNTDESSDDIKYIVGMMEALARS